MTLTLYVDCPRPRPVQTAESVVERRAAWLRERRHNLQRGRAHVQLSPDDMIR